MIEMPFYAAANLGRVTRMISRVHTVQAFITDDNIVKIDLTT